MRTHHVPFYAALVVGLFVAIALTMVTGQWLDMHHTIGREGILRFLAAAVVIILAVEAGAGRLGDWIDEQMTRRRQLPS